ncbi:MAG TPA: condensation domain-containing protein [Archangium sp.]|jgi:acyl carrier protein|uniref:condensation domain-containing protein n=1 Tax=Archangium sp. TaxID=1872627 RepID=UPI002ED92C70
MDRQKIEDIYELSPAQQGMFFQSMLNQSPGMLCEQFLCILEGVLDVAVLQRACAHVISRHPALRTSFHLMELDKPLQVVHRSVPLPWRELDWRQHSSEAVTKELEALLKEDREQGFEPRAAPLLRFCVIHLSGDRHQFIWSHHHLLMDGWSLPVVMKEILVCYESFSRGERPRLKPSWPYREYIAYLQSRRLEQARPFWQAQLRDLHEPTPLGRGPTAAGADELQELMLKVPSELAARLGALAREHRVTPSSLFQAVWALLLGVHGQRDDVVFGTTVSGRPATPAEAASSVGLFINTLPLRVVLQPEETLVGFLGRMQAQRLDLQEYEHTPLVQIQEWSGLPRGKALFDTLLVFENFPQDISVAPLRVREVRVLGGETPYALTAIVDPENGYSLRLIHRGPAIDSALAHELRDTLLLLLLALVDTPERPLGELLTALRTASTPASGEPAREPSEMTRRQLTEADAPRTPVERELWSIWCELLGTREVGIHDDFFRLGGHSLMATQAISRVRQAFGTDIPLKALFTSGRTIAELAVTLEEHLISKSSEGDLASLYAELENLSEDEAERLLREEENAP